MNIILALCIPLAFIAGGYVAFKGVHLGLRWQQEVKQDKQPTMTNPIAEVIHKKKAEKDDKEQANIFNEWVNGVKEG